MVVATLASKLTLTGDCFVVALLCGVDSGPAVPEGCLGNVVSTCAGFLVAFGFVHVIIEVWTVVSGAIVAGVKVPSGSWRGVGSLL